MPWTDSDDDEDPGGDEPSYLIALLVALVMLALASRLLLDLLGYW